MKRRINFARLNHLLIPPTKEGRDRLRRTRLGRVFGPLGYLYQVTPWEGQSFFAVSIVAGGLGLDVTRTDAHRVWAVMTALLLISLLLSLLHRMRGVQLEVGVPRRVSVGEEVVFSLQCRNQGTAAAYAVRFEGPFLPWDGRWTRPRPSLAVLPAGETGRVEMRARFSARGDHHLDPFRAAALVPLGLMTGPPVHSSDCRFLVVPRIANVTHVSTPLGGRHQPGGVALASKTGEAMDLRGVRPYRPGDAVRDLHARSWARVGAPVVREYQQEYFSRIGVIVDTDLGQGAAELPEEQLEAALELGAGVVGRLSRGEALIDLLVLGGRVHTLHALTLGRSLGTFEQALDLLGCVAAGPPLHAEQLLQQLSPHLPRLSCLLLIALRWDNERDQLCRRVRSLGVGCRAFVVTAGEPSGSGAGAAWEGGQDVRSIPMDAITRGEALRL